MAQSVLLSHGAFPGMDSLRALATPPSDPSGLCVSGAPFTLSIKAFLLPASHFLEFWDTSTPFLFGCRPILVPEYLMTF